jgi:hypothetical protein
MRPTFGETLGSCEDVVIGVGLCILYSYLVLSLLPAHWITVVVALFVFTFAMLCSNLSPVAIKVCGGGSSESEGRALPHVRVAVAASTSASASAAASASASASASVSLCLCGCVGMGRVCVRVWVAV